MEKELEELVLCQCENAEHQIIFRTISGDDDVYMTIHLCKLSFWKRLLHGLKYIFGYRCMYGDFDEIILRNEDINKFENVVKWLKTNHNPIK
jgi:hypothetical protein